MNLNVNIGRTEKYARIALGALLVFLGLADSTILFIIGVVLVVTGFISFCPVYHWLKKSTAAAEDQTDASWLDRGKATMAELVAVGKTLFGKAKAKLNKSAS